MRERLIGFRHPVHIVPFLNRAAAQIGGLASDKMELGSDPDKVLAETHAKYLEFIKAKKEKEEGKDGKEEGAKAVCLTCEVNVDLKRKIFAHDHSNEISMVARTRYPFFGESLKSGCFTLGTRGYFWVPRHVIGESGNVFPGREQCVNFPISEV